jgi:hypothetical protein
MDYMIIVKWVTNWEVKEAETGEIAPGIINTMIIMFIQGGSKPCSKQEDCPGTQIQSDLMPN